jgi:Tfp pilus assembly protein PilN
VRPVNLLPEQYRARRPSGKAAGSSRIVIGVLGGLLVMAIAYAVTANQVNSRTSEIAAAKSEIQRAQVQASSQDAFGSFHSMKETRETSVKQLAGGRFDWERLMREVALVLPKRTWVLDMTASTSAEGGSGTAGSTPAATPPSTAGSSTGTAAAAAPANPTVHLTGCALHQDDVAVLLVRLRKLDRATDVKLTESAKEEQEASGAQVATDAAGGGSDTCQGGRFKFDVTVTFSPPSPADLEHQGHVRTGLGGGS